MEWVITEVIDLGPAWPDIAHLLLALHEHHLLLTGQRLLPEWAEKQKRHIESMRQSGLSLLLLARSGPTAVGFIYGQITENPTLFEERVGFIHDAFIAPEFRGSGLFSELLQAMETWFKSNSVPEVRLGVVSANEHARDIWQAKGYEILSELRRERL